MIVMSPWEKVDSFFPRWYRFEYGKDRYFGYHASVLFMNNVYSWNIYEGCYQEKSGTANTAEVAMKEIDYSFTHGGFRLMDEKYLIML